MNPAANIQTSEVGDARLQGLASRLIDSALECLRQPAGGVLVSQFHQARRLRQAGDVQGALARLHGLEVTEAGDQQRRWAYSEWLDMVRRAFPGQDLLVYCPYTGRAAALAARSDGTLEVVAALGMTWQVGKVVSRRSIRGLKPLKGGQRCPSTQRG